MCSRSVNEVQSHTQVGDFDVLDTSVRFSLLELMTYNWMSHNEHPLRRAYNGERKGKELNWPDKTFSNFKILFFSSKDVV